MSSDWFPSKAPWLLILNWLSHWSVGCVSHWSVGCFVSHWSVGCVSHWSLGCCVCLTGLWDVCLTGLWDVVCVSLVCGMCLKWAGFDRQGIWSLPCYGALVGNQFHVTCAYGLNTRGQARNHSHCHYFTSWLQMMSPLSDQFLFCWFQKSSLTGRSNVWCGSVANSVFWCFMPPARWWDAHETEREAGAMPDTSV